MKKLFLLLSLSVSFCAPAATGGPIEQAYQKHQSDLQIKDGGTVTNVLSDDNKGARHQRFIIKLASGQTLLITNNIDLAPRIPSLKNGDRVDFYGEYEWNNKGGVIHWTHHDPGKKHTGGWLKHRGKTYH